MSTNPFRQPVPKSGVLLTAKLWTANHKGKDDSRASLQIMATSEYVWLGRDLSIPVAWLKGLEAVGPGFRLAWSNPIDQSEEHAFFCIRTFFGYNTQKRDELLARLGELAAASKANPVPPVVQQTAAVVQCEVCGSPLAEQYNLHWYINVLFYWVSRPDRKLLCRDCASSKVRLMLLSNSLLGSLGFPGAIVGPYTTWVAAQEARRVGLVSLPAGLLLTVMSAAPILAILLLVFYVAR
ncbi:MAG: hypothetical protein AB2L07_03140 [Thermoanaerobaculaceae bacterium]